jgi:MFS transporter, DHA1 family, inner membrane transport protein
VLRIGPVRRALLALAVGGFAIGTGEFVIVGLLPNVARDLKATIPQTGHMVSAYALGVVVGAPVLTVLCVRLPRKGLLISLMIAFAAGNVASALAPTLGWEVIARFIAGLPHGAFFGAGAVAAAGMVEEGRRTAAMSVMFAGLTVATVVGVPLTTLLGQDTSWRLVFALVGVIALLAAVSVAVLVPPDRTEPDERSTRALLQHELGAFANGQIWLALAIATLGCGGLFATFSYISPMMTRLAHYSESGVTWLLVLFGLGMTVGNLVGARLADRSLMRTLYGSFVAEVVVASLFLVTSHSKVGAAITVFALPATFLAGLPALQTRIINLAGGAPNLAAASTQAAFNVANSLGAWLGGVVIAEGYGYDAPNVVAAGLAAVGLALAITSGALEGRSRRVRRRAPMAAVAEA